MVNALKSLNLWERIGYPAGHYFSYSGLSVAFDLVGLHGMAGRYHRLSFRVAGELEDPLAWGYAHQGLIIHYSWLGLPEKAIEHGTETVRYHREAGFLRGLAQAKFMMAETLAYQGYVERAGVLANEALSIGQEAGDAQVEFWGPAGSSGRGLTLHPSLELGR